MKHSYVNGLILETLEHEPVEDEQDAHLYHARGWWRELWYQAMGMNPVLPPIEDTSHARAAERAEYLRPHNPQLSGGKPE